MLGINRLLTISHEDKLYNCINNGGTVQNSTSSHNKPFTIKLL